MMNAMYVYPFDMHVSPQQTFKYLSHTHTHTHTHTMSTHTHNNTMYAYLYADSVVVGIVFTCVVVLFPIVLTAMICLLIRKNNAETKGLLSVLS